MSLSPPKNTGSTISPFLIGTNKSDNVFNSWILSCVLFSLQSNSPRGYWVVLSKLAVFVLEVNWVYVLKNYFQFGWCSITEDANWNVSSLRRMSCSPIEGMKVHWLVHANIYIKEECFSQLSLTSWYFVSPPFAHASLIWSRFSLRVDSHVGSFLCRVCGCTARPKVYRHCISLLGTAFMG